jgi:hypothetical protein
MKKGVFNILFVFIIINTVHFSPQFIAINKNKNYIDNDEVDKKIQK